jgi:EmrB/QacA subfamily drug resistance transporter
MERSALFVATLTSFMGPFMVSSVNVALPAIQEEWGVDAVLLSWVSTVYLLATAVLLVPIGRIADIRGRKKVFTAGLTVYTAASALAVFVPSIGWLIAARAFQGFGAAMFITTGMAILTSVFPPERRGRAIGIYVAAVYIGLSVGPFVGGLMTQHLGWRSLFAVMLPLGGLSVAATIRFLEGEWADSRGEPFDRVGAVLYAIAVMGIVYGATALPGLPAASFLAAGALSLAAFLRQERRTAHPVFDVALFLENRTFAFSSLAAFLHYAATFAVTFLMSLFLQHLKGLPPQVAGFLLVTQPAVMAAFSPAAGRLADRIEPRWLASAGMGITGLGLLLFTGLGPETGLPAIAANLALLGFGFALFSSPNMSAIMGAVDRGRYGVASGAVATMRLLGQMASMTAATLVLETFVGRSPIGPDTFGRFTAGMHAYFALFSVLCCVGIGFSLARGTVLERD